MTEPHVRPFAYAPAPEASVVPALRARKQIFVGADCPPSDDGATYADDNPANEDVLAEVALAAAEDVDRAVRAARRGFEKYWRKTRPAERAKYGFRLARLLHEHTRELAYLESVDAGIPIRHASERDVPEAEAQLFYHAGWADKLEWAVRAHERIRPVGVVAAMVAGESPLASAAARIGPALACGNAVVLKPGGSTPLSSLALAELCTEADLPPGVVNVVTGGAATGAALAAHADVDCIAFQGTTDLGKAIRRDAAGSRKRTALELIGKPAFVLFEDAPLDDAVEAILAGPGARIYAAESIASEVERALVERLASLACIDPLDGNAEVAPLHSREDCERILALVAEDERAGARVIRACAPPPSGYWFPPTLVANVLPTYRTAFDDVSGPPYALETFRVPREAIERVNARSCGRAASVWTVSGALAAHAARQLRPGTVWCNGPQRSEPPLPAGLLTYLHV